MPATHRTPPFNPLEICFCCANNSLAKPWNDVPYQERQRFTFIPRYNNPTSSQPNVKYCPKCEAKQCNNMPGRNHYRTYIYVRLKGKQALELQFLQVGRVINTVGKYRESFQLSGLKPRTLNRPQGFAQKK